MVEIEAKDIAPTVSWGTSPQDVVAITGAVPTAETIAADRKAGLDRKLEYMGLKGGEKMTDIVFDKVRFPSTGDGGEVSQLNLLLLLLHHTDLHWLLHECSHH